MESQTTDNEREYYSGLKCTNRARAAFDTCMCVGPPRRHAAPAAVLTVYGNSLTRSLCTSDPRSRSSSSARYPEGWAPGGEARAGHALKMNSIPFGKGSMRKEAPFMMGIAPRQRRALDGKVSSKRFQKAVSHDCELS